MSACLAMCSIKLSLGSGCFPSKRNLTGWIREVLGLQERLRGSAIGLQPCAHSLSSAEADAIRNLYRDRGHSFAGNRVLPPLDKKACDSYPRAHQHTHAQSASTTARPRSDVRAVPPRSGRARPTRARCKHSFDLRRRSHRAHRADPEKSRQHRTGPDLPDRVGDALAGDVGRRAVQPARTEKAPACRVQIRRKVAMPIVPVHAGPRSLRMSAEQVARDDHIEESAGAVRSAR